MKCSEGGGKGSVWGAARKWAKKRIKQIIDGGIVSFVLIIHLFWGYVSALGLGSPGVHFLRKRNRAVPGSHG